MWGHGYGDMMYGFGGMWLLWFLILAGIGVLVFAVVRLASQSRGKDQAPQPPATPGAVPGTGSTARAILEERYARGEIDTAEFNERLQALERR